MRSPTFEISGVILDVDGTLVDSNDAHAAAWQTAFDTTPELQGFNHINFDRIRHLIGKGGEKLLLELTGLEKDSDLGKRLSALRSKIFSENYLPFLKPFEGSEPLLKQFHENGLRLAIASSAEAGELKSLLKICGADKYVEEVSSSDDAKHSKPDPDIIQAALKKMKLQPSQAVMLGDTPYDIEAATRAGCKCIAFRSGGWSDLDLMGAFAVYDDVGDLLTQYDISIFAQKKLKNSHFKAA